MLFPAHAGVIPLLVCVVMAYTTFPRTRGGDPSRRFLDVLQNGFSPHTRG